ncbi:hypothetical protein LEP1GSC013_4011 [Leptospira interrogans serovar Valbuzzi str. Duyster]|nr:hypothetical protein LEP1GSC013_4011 [Leptospira interrogans serovar Valbuzzi str. Duyster]ENO71789.1 hypothetical protein LEP1GSC012_3409 [Leptospira interrogans serovar Valbuzzi str. Valbuzzi]
MRKKDWANPLSVPVNKLHEKNVMRYFFLSYNRVVEKFPSSD